MRRRLLGTLAAVALTATSLTACLGHPDNAGARNGTLTISGDAGNPTLVENFNPYQPATELHGTFLIYEPLEIRSPIDGSYTPFLATGFSFSNPTTLVYRLRQGVTWSDGQPLTGQDIAFTFQLLKKYPALDTAGVWGQLSGVQTTDTTATFTFKQPNVPFAGVLAGTPIVPQHIWSSVGDPTKYANTKPVGSGPFILDKFAPTQYSLAKNPTYWQADKIAPSQVLFPAKASNSTTDQLDTSAGKFDWSYNFLPDVKQTYLDRSPQTNTYWFPPGGAIGLFLNLTKAPYNNVDFRRGISLSLNRSQIATKAVNGYLGQASQSGLILPNLQKWLDDSLPNKGNVGQDVPAALAAFAKAGYTKNGNRLVSSAGKTATMTITAPQDFSDWVAAAKEIVNQLGAVGIKVTLDLPQYDAYSKATQGGTFDAAFGGFGGTGDPYTDFNTMLNSTFAAPVNTPTANNFERFKDAGVDQALGALAKATDLPTQKRATNALEQVMYNDVPIVLMYYGGSWGLFSTKNFTGWPSQADPYTLPTNYNNAMLTVLTHLKRS
ncbi:MAG: ABC transporter substrate-binding protein [Actinomycetota bacterium]|nr:ABC transporter substrate-binding protein [Actinomycetota bacterium]MDQ2957466.1 ABC transporter substrate-binding protein [Actinomycetota bacterium]